MQFLHDFLNQDIQVDQSIFSEGGGGREVPCKLFRKKSPLSLFFLPTKYFNLKWESRLYASNSFLKK